MVTQDDIRREVKYWTRMFGLSQWRIKVTFNVDDTDSYAECHTSPEYFMATISFNVDRLGKQNRKTLQHTVVHELLHVLLSPYTQLAKKLAVDKTHRRALEFQEETMVSLLEKAPLWKELH